VSLSVDAYQRFVSHDPSRCDVAIGLWIGVPHLVVNRGSTSLGARLLETLFGVRE
jgi:hypothetical protein